MAFKDILKLCKKHIGMLIILPLCVGILTAMFCYFVMPDEYTSSKRIYVLANPEKYAYDYNPSRWNEQSEMSYGINFSQQLCNDVAELVKSSKIRDAVANDVNVDSLDKYRITVESSEKNRVITLNVTDYDPEMAAKIVDSLAKRTAELSKQVTDAESVNIIDETKVPETISGPPRIIITLVAIAIALFISLVIVLIRDVLDTTIKSREELIGVLDLSLMSSNPKVKL